MKVSFTSPIEDFVDIAIRSGGDNRSFYLNVIAVAAGFGGIGGFLAYLYFQNWFASIVGFSVGFLYIVASNFGVRQRRVRKFYREQFGTEGPIEIEAEISGAGLSFNQGGVTVVRDWGTVQRIEESEDAIYFYSRGGLVSAVRKRGFKSDIEQKTFLNLARDSMAAAAVPRPPRFNEEPSVQS